MVRARVRARVRVGAHPGGVHHERLYAVHAPQGEHGVGQRVAELCRRKYTADYAAVDKPTQPVAAGVVHLVQLMRPLPLARAELPPG